MAQTKRKRRTKHRGNAAGMVETRGNTGKQLAGAPAKNGTRSASTRSGSKLAPGAKPPTYKAAALKALFGVAILFVFFRFLSGRDNSTGQALAFCAVAFVMYMPVMYLTDKFIYNRRLKQQAAGKR
jgi:hypothetical protein